MRTTPTNFALAFECTVTNEETKIGSGKRKKEYYDNGYALALDLPNEERELVHFPTDVFEPLTKEKLMRDLMPGKYWVFATGWLDWTSSKHVETGWETLEFSTTFDRIEVRSMDLAKRRK